MDGSTLDTGNAQGHPSIVDFVVGKLFQEGIGDLCEAETLLGFDEEGHDWNAVEHDCAHLKVQRVWELGLKNGIKGFVDR